MQSMLNRITINCINSKNTTDSKHRPSAHNRLVHRSDVSDDPLFPQRRSMTKIYIFYEGSLRKGATYYIAMYHFCGRKLRHLRFYM